MFLYLEKYLSQEIQATRFEILKTLICGSLNTVSCTFLQVESNLGTSPHWSFILKNPFQWSYVAHQTLLYCK